MEVLHEDDGKKGRFYIMENGQECGEISYVWTGEDKLIIDHTVVDPRLKGQNVGYKLVTAVVNMAREKNVKVIPLCPFAKAVMTKKEELQDVLTG